MKKGFLRLFILCGLVIAITVSIMSQEISLKSTPTSLKILPGEPATFQLTIRNTSGKNLKIIGTNLEHALTPTESILISPDGKAFKCSHMAIEVAPGIQPPCQRPTVLFPTDGTVTMVYGIHSQKSCPLSSISPGTYTGRVTVEIRVCCNGNAKDIKQTLDIPVIVVTPQGQDAAYLKAIEEMVKKQPPKYTGIYGGELKWMEVLHSPRIHSEQLLLSDFPTSTYAACAVYRIMHGFMQGDENMFLRSVERGTYLSNSYPDGTGKSKDGWCWLKGQAAVDWWSKWINIILANHPDIWFADQLRLKRAVDQVALKNYQAGAADLKTLSQEATPEVAQKAQKMLDMMKRKGWIKKQPEAPKQ